MKKTLIIIMTLALVAAILFSNNLNGTFVKNSIAQFLGNWDEFKTEYGSYRIFDGGMMGEHNVEKTSHNYYDGSYYNQLSPNEKAVYDGVKSCNFSDAVAEIVLPEPVFFYSAYVKPTEEEMESVGLYISRTYQRAVDALLMDGDDAFYIKMGEGGSVCRYEYTSVHNGERFVWLIDKIKMEIVVKECYKNPDEFRSETERVANAFIPNGDTRYQQVKSIHDYVVNIATYEDTPYSDDAYGALVQHRATCAGFSRAFKLLCDKNNIPCVLVTGIGITEKESGEHMWCLVQMEDGLWYGVDPTWDDYGGSEYLLVGGSAPSAFSDRKFNETHIPLQDFTGFGYTPFVYPPLSDSSYLK